MYKRRNTLAFQLVPLKVPLMNIQRIDTILQYIEVDVYDVKARRKLGRYKLNDAKQKFG